MREYVFTLDECFKNGLRPSQGDPHEGQYMDVLINARPTESGLDEFYPVKPIFEHLNNWPFPQVFRVDNKYVVGTKGKLWEQIGGILREVITETGSLTWDVDSIGALGVATSSGGFFGVRSPETGIWKKNIDSPRFPNAKAVCNFRGQFLVGNLDNWFNCRENFFAWSNIGELNFHPDLRNEAGFRPVHWEGEVYKIKHLGDNVIVYGENGIAVITPVVSPAPTFKYDELAGDGLQSKNSVGGDFSNHLYLSSAKRLIKLTADGKGKFLDYYNYMKDLREDLVTISYDPHLGDFYISDGVKGYLLTHKGLAEIHQCVSSIVTDPDVLIGGVASNGNTGFMAVTDYIDFGYRSSKTTTTIEVASTSDTPIEVAVDARMNSREEFTRSDWVELNDQGFATLAMAGVEFKICLRSKNFNEIHIDYVNVRYKMTDMRSIRGVYAPPLRGQGDKE